MWFFGSKKERIYLDHASATPVRDEAGKAFTAAVHDYGNPGSIHQEGVRAKASLTSSRETIALELGCKAREVVFVSGGTEANNLAILGTARQLLVEGKDLKKTHWIVSSIEHPSVLECFGEIERLGGHVDFVDPDKRGIIRPEEVVALVKKQTVFVSIGWSNHEIGIVQPLRDIIRAVRSEKESVMCHTDAGQAPVYLIPHVHTLDADLMSLDSGKLYGPRGIGAVYASARARLSRVMLGGSQERGLRAGTENVALAAGFAAALRAIGAERRGESERIGKLRDDLLARICERVPEAIVNGVPDRSLPHMLNVSIPGIQSEYVTLALDHAGVAISTKSACREGEDTESRVVALLGGEPWRARTTLRFSLGRSTRADEVARAADELARILAHSKS